MNGEITRYETNRWLFQGGGQSPLTEPIQGDPE